MKFEPLVKRFSSLIKKRKEILATVDYVNIRISTLKGHLLSNEELKALDQDDLKNVRRFFHWGAMVNINDVCYFNFFTTHPKTSLIVGGLKEEFTNYPVRDIPYVKKNLPFKYLNPIIQMDSSLVDKYFEKNYKVSRIPKDIKHHYFKDQRLGMEKLFRDTLFITEQNFKYNDKYLILKDSGEMSKLEIVDDISSIFTKKELLLSRDEFKLKHLYNGKWEKKQVVLKHLEVDEDFSNN